MALKDWRILDKEYLEVQFQNFATKIGLVFARETDIPKNVSDLKNDEKFLKEEDLPVMKNGKVGVGKPDGTSITVDDDGTMHATGQSEGTMDYEALNNLPSINDIQLVGNKSLKELGIQEFGNYLKIADLEDYSTKDETGYSLGMEVDPESFEITFSLKTKSGEELSTQTLDLPIESAVVGIKVNKEDKTITLVLQNGTETDPIPFSDLLIGVVGQDFTIAGIDMKDDITKEELQSALDVPIIKLEEEDINFSNYFAE